MNLLENVLGGGSVVGGLFGEFREAFVGGCWGIIMSAFFFFFFFFTLLAWLFGVDIQGILIGGAASPIIALFCVSGLMSPLIGILFGAQTGIYSMVKHVGCFVLYMALLLFGIFALSTML
jgi:hypothetical protein